MGIAEKFLRSVSEIYTTLNPITLSGVNDVVVVQDENGTMRCSPFQVRFSKLLFNSIKSQVVHIYVNGKLTDIKMNVTSQGDVFFVDKETSVAESYLFQNNYTSEVSLESILDHRLEFTKEKKKEKTEHTIVYDRRVYSASTVDLQAISPNDKTKDDTSLKFGDDEVVHADSLNKARLENLSLRIFAMHNMPHLHNGLYNLLAEKYSRVSTMLTAPDHYDALLEKAILLASLVDALIQGRRSAKISFSLCAGSKIERSIEETFASYLVTEIDSPESTIVCIEMPIGCSSGGNVCNCRMGVYMSPHKTIRFYFTYLIFSRMFFEAKNSKNTLHKIIDFLEREYNNALGWNIFGKRQFMKRNIGFSLKLNSDDLRSLHLKPGKNDIVFKIGGIKRQLEGNIFLWNINDKVVISDIDGTITKSDIRGHLYGFVGKDWTHTGVAGLFSRISRNGYRILYLTARPLGQSSITKDYLRAVSQDSYSLPEGPVLLNPSGLFEALYREVIIKKPEVFKIDCLQEIMRLFNGKNPFIAGFGNRVSDVFAYTTLKIPRNKIYTINPNGQLVAEYTRSLVGTYHTMNEFVDSIFPALHKSPSLQLEYMYGDFGWWNRSDNCNNDRV